MIFFNPQWQGAADASKLTAGAHNLFQYFANVQKKESIPVLDGFSPTINNIKYFEPLLSQATHFRQLIAKNAPDTISTVGGDCGIEIMPISYLNKKYGGNLGVVWIDAHADLNTPESSPSKTFHGMPLRTLLGDGDEKFVSSLFSTLKPDQIVLVGLRDLDPPEQEFITKNQVAINRDGDYTGIAATLAKYANVYIHLDLDVLDPAEYPYTMFPTPAGLPVARITQVIERFMRDKRVVGICVTESTAETAAQLKPITPILEYVKLFEDKK